jgi:hypothetical protein
MIRNHGERHCLEAGLLCLAGMARRQNQYDGGGRSSGYGEE